MNPIARCTCGSSSARETDDSGDHRRLCTNKKCNRRATWHTAPCAADAAWNKLMGEPGESVTWTTTTDGTHVWVETPGYPDSSWLSVSRFGPLDDTLAAGPCELTITVKRVDAEPEEPAEPQSESRERRVAADVARLVKIWDNPVTLSRRLDLLGADMDSHRLDTAAHNYLALYQRINDLETKLDAHFATPVVREPPDVEPDCPDDCRLVEFRGVGGDLLFSHPIVLDYCPTYVQVGDVTFRLAILDGRLVYQVINVTDHIKNGEPLRPEASDD